MTRVKLVEGPHPHAEKWTAPFMEIWKDWAGREITIGRPEDPTIRTCETDLAWPIEGPEELIARLKVAFGVTASSRRKIMICRHMFQAGD